MLGWIRRALHRREFDRRTRDILNRIEQFGWAYIYVGDYQRGPAWAYTIGLHASLSAPEVIVFDVPADAVSGLFYQIHDDLKNGLVIREGEAWRPNELPHPAIWRRVHPSRLGDNDPEHPWMGLAEDFAKILRPDRGPISAFQLVCSDHNGNLPWESGYDERLRHLQRALWDPVELAAARGV